MRLTKQSFQLLISHSEDVGSQPVRRFVDLVIELAVVKLEDEVIYDPH